MMKTLRTNTRRGMAYALTMFVLFIILCLTLLGICKTAGNGGLMSQSDDATLLARDNMATTVAFNLAESGIEYTIEWLHQQPYPPANTSGFGPSLWNIDSVKSTATRTYVDMTWPGGAGTFGVTMYPVSTNSGSVQKQYLVESIGTYNGTSQIVSALVQQSSFGKYAYFTDWDSSNGYWECGVDSFDGPMHSNNSNGAPTNIIWQSASGSQPMFKYTGNDAYTCVSNTIGWNENSIGNYTAPATTANWANIAAGGQGTVHTSTSSVAMPTASTIQMTAALASASAPTSAGPSVLIPSSNGATTGGIYIHATPPGTTATSTVDEIVLSTSNGGTAQNIEIDQTDLTTNPTTKVKTYIVTNPTNNTTTSYNVKTQGWTVTTSAVTTYSGVTDGVVYSDSSIGHQSSMAGTDSTSAANSGNYYYGTDKTGGVHGVIADNTVSGTTITHSSGLTIATAANANTNIDGSISTYTQRATDTNGNYIDESLDSNYTMHAGTFGMVSDAVEVVNNDVNGHALTNVEVDGSVLAYDTFDCTDIFGRPVGSFQVVGGYIARTGGFFGVINGNGALLAGFQEHYNYDQRLANSPPPYFPTTGNQYDITSWQRVGGTVP